MDILIMHFVDPDKMADYRRNMVPYEIQNHEKVAAHYGIPTINLAREVTDRIGNGEFTWENDFKNLHPSPFGHHIYYQSLKRFLDTCWNAPASGNDKLTNYTLPEKSNEACYNKGVLIPAAACKAPQGWNADQNWKPADNTGTRADFVNLPMMIAEGPARTKKIC
jgi:sialidase-1